MALKIGKGTIAKIYSFDRRVGKIYLGDSQIWVGSPYSDEATAVLNRYSNLSQTETDAIVAYVDAEVADGNWQYIDELFLFALNPTDALIGMKSFTSYVIKGSPIWTPNGYSFDGVDDVINTTIQPDLNTTHCKYTGGLMHIFVYDFDPNPAVSAYICGSRRRYSGESRLNITQATNAVFRFHGYTGTIGYGRGCPFHKGYISTGVTATGNNNIYRDGVWWNDSSGTENPLETPLFIGSSHDASFEGQMGYSTYWKGTVSCFAVTADNSKLDIAAHNVNIRNLLEALGVDVFNPLQIGTDNLTGWFDGEAASVTLSDATHVSQWYNKGCKTSTPHLIQATAANQPYWNPTLKKVSFTEDVNRIMLANFSAFPLDNNNFEVFVVGRKTDNTRQIVMYCFEDTDGTMPYAQMEYQPRQNSLTMFIGNDSTYKFPNLDKPSPFPDATLERSLFNTYCNNAYGRYNRINEIEVYDGVDYPDYGNYQSTILNYFRVGNRYSGHSFGGATEVNEIIIYNRRLTEEERAKVVAYLKNKWNSLLSYNPELLIDASNYNSIVLSDSTHIEEIKDLSGNNYHHTQDTLVYQPEYSGGVIVSVSNKALERIGSIISGTQAFSIVSVFKVNNNGGILDSYPFAICTNTVTNNGEYIRVSGEIAARAGSRVTYNSQMLAGESSVVISTKDVNEYLLDIKTYRDGSLLGISSSSGNPQINLNGYRTILVNGRYDHLESYTTHTLDGELKEFAIFNRVLSISEVQAISYHLMNKWNIS